MRSNEPTRLFSSCRPVLTTALWIGAALGLTCATRAAITQDPAADYIAWAATNDVTIANGTPTTWAVVPDAASSGGFVLEEQGTSDTANVASTAAWSLIFKTPGTYQLYIKYRLNPCCGGNSYNFPTAFGATPTYLVSKANENGSGPTTFTVLKEQAQSGGALATFTVTQADVDNVTPLTFKIGTREAPGLRIDRIMLSTVTALDQAGFDALQNSGAGFSITAQPADLAVDVGQNATYSVTAAGGVAPYTFQWYTNGVADTANGSGATYTRTNVQPTDSGMTFRVVVTDANLTALNSRVATLTTTPVHFTSEPADASAPLNQPVTFSASVVSGTVPYTFVWRTNGVVDPTATNSTYTLANATAADSGRTFQLIVTDSALTSITSRVATLTVLDRAGLIAVSFTGRGDCAPGCSTLGNSTVAGLVPQGYWNNITNSDVFGGVSSVFQDGNGTATTVTLTYDANDSWNNDGASGTANEKLMKGISKAGGNNRLNTYTFNNVPATQAYDLVALVNVNGDNRIGDFAAGGITYYATLQHQFGGSFIQIVSQNASARTFGNYLLFTNLVPNASGQIAMTMVNRGDADGIGLAGFQLIPKGPVLSFASQPADALGRWQGTTVKFTSAAAFGTGPYTYQWYTNGVADTSPAGQGPVYTLSNISTAQNNFTYYVVITDSAAASIISRTATLTVSSANPARDFSMSFVGRDSSDANGIYVGKDEVVGAAPRTNWNHNQYSGKLSTMSGVSPALTNDIGEITPVTIAYAANDSWNSDGGSTSANERMMKGIIKDQNGYTGSFIANNLPPEAAYDVYVYGVVNGGGTGDVRYDVWVRDQADATAGTVGRTNYSRQSGSFSGTFTRADNFNPAGPYPIGNYVVLTNAFTDAAGQLFIGHKHISGSDGAGYAGIQLIRRNDVTIQPLNMTSSALVQSPNPVFEGSPTTLSGPTIQSVGPRYYQWQTNTANDLSGSWVDVVGETNRTLVVTPVFADSGRQYRVIVANNAPSAVTSAPIAIQVIQDITPPTLVRVLGGALRNNVKFVFSEPILATDATNTSKYVITNSSGAVLPITGASISANGSEVTLTTAAQGYGETYGAVVTGVRDRALNPNTITPNPSSATFTSYDMDFLPGQVLFRAYPTGGGNSIGELTNHPSFPNSPDYQALITGMNSRLAPAPYSNNGRENYGGTVAGHFLPPVSGNYIFYVSSDDDGQLVMNTNGPSPAGAVQVRFAPGCCRALSAGADPTVPISLIAGQAYYIEGRFKEGTGGDYVEVGARLVTDNSTIVPIPGAQLALGSRLVITQPPTDLTLEEYHDGVFRVGVAASGVGAGFYQWQRSTDNTGTTFTNIPGATSSNLIVGPVRLDEDGIKFRILVTNAVSSVSATSTLHVIADVIAPRVVSATVDGALRTVFVNFNEAMDTNSGLSEPLFYTFYQNGTPLELSYTATNITSSNVVLKLTPGQLTENTVYSVEVCCVTDASGNDLDVAYSTASFRTPIRSRGLVKYDFYFDLGASQDIGSLLNSPKFPNSPDLTIYTNSLNWGGFPTVLNAPETTTNNYGLRVSGFYVPSVSGTHTFWIRNDDSARFSLSTDDTATNLVMLQNVGCCNGTFASPVAVDLVAGTRYYFEALLKEATGNDNLALAVNEPGSTSTNIISPANLVVALDATNAPNAGIAVQPQNVTVEENRSATLSVVVTNTGGYPPFVQWQTNAGAGFGDFPGAVGTTVTTPPMPLAANGLSIRAVVYLPALTLISDAAQIFVNPDTNAPVALGAASANGTQVGVRFNELLTSLNANDTNNYTVDGQLPLSATLRPDGSNVVLITAVPVGKEFVVTYSNVVDIATTPNALTNGAVLGKYWIDSVVDINGPAPAGTHFTAKDGELEVVAGGADVWGTSDQFTYAFTTRTNDFDVKVRVDSIKYIGNSWSKAGINVRESTNANSRMIWFYPVPKEGANAFEGAVRFENGGDVSDLGQPRPASFFPAWLRLVRSGSAFTPYLSTNGQDWVVFGTNVPWNAPQFPATLLVGVGTVSHIQGAATTAQFAELGDTHPTVGFQKLGTNLVIRWDGSGELQYADELNAPVTWTPVPAATSPYVVPIDQAHRYYRVRRLFPNP